MITNDGKLLIKRYLMGAESAIARSLALGVATNAEASTDTSLGFEVIRGDIYLVSYDFNLDRLVFKATIPSEFAGIVYETALFTLQSNDLANGYPSRALATFDSDTEDWSNATFTATAARIGADALVHTPATSTSVTSALTNLALDLSGYSNSDQMRFAYNVGNANATLIRFRFMTDASNYYDFTMASPGTAGYKTTSVNKSTATVTGAPNWGNITEIDVTTTSGAGGAASVTFDGIRIEDVDTQNTSYVCVARELLAAPFTKVAGTSLDIEFSLAVTIT